LRVLSKIADRLAGGVERIAAPWLPRSSADMKTRPSELKALRYVLSIGVASLVVVPAALMNVTSPAVALPVGVALAAAVTLMSSVGVLAAVRTIISQMARPSADALPEADHSHYDHFPGLVTLHDARGFVTAVHGRDKSTLLPWLRDIKGMGFLELVHVSDRLHFLQALDSLRQGAAHETVNLRFEKFGASRNDHQFVYVRTDLAALRNDKGALSGILAQSIDISEVETLRHEATLRTRDAAGAHEAKTRFLAAVSHELRTPLNAILGFSDILKGEFFGPLANDRQKEYVALINESGHHLLSVVNTMLDMSKIEAGRYELITEPFEIYPAVESCSAMLDLQARVKGVVLANRVSRHAGDLTADQRAIKQILINLVGNAIKFTEKGGVVTIDVEEDEANMALVISDTGIGISPQMLSQVGQPFMQVQSNFTRNYEGTGLGLSLVKGLVALHGGTFAIKSEVGHGTIVTVTLPKDGSGVIRLDDNATDDRQNGMVDFPPRLTSHVAARDNDKDWFDDRTTEAQSA